MFKIDRESLTLRKLAHEFFYLPMSYRVFFFLIAENEKFIRKNSIFFLIFAQNIDRECTRRGGSNEYPQSMFWSKNKKNRYTPAYPSFTCLQFYFYMV